MANTTFENLKINALRYAGNNYNASDATRLTIAGGLINEVLGMIGGLLKGHPFTLDLGNTVSTVQDQPYVSLTPTDIIEVLQFYQHSTNTKLKQITYQDYVTMYPNTGIIGGVPENVWAPTQTLTTGVNTWSIYLGWTPSSAITMYYDYIKSMQFSADGTSADAEYSPMPRQFDRWIYDEFAPLFYGIIDPTDVGRISKAESKAEKTRIQCLNDLRYPASSTIQMGRFGHDVPQVFKPVATTPAP